MYVTGFVLAVPEGNRQVYKDVAEGFWDIAREYGALSQVECWEVDVPDGKTTDFRRAVKAEDGERIVFAWMTWPDKQTAEAGHEKMMTDPRMEGMAKDVPFDGTRMIYGGFEPLVMKSAD
ncbi:RNA signal recognition particle [Altererythrobacter sp. B11]|nr:RNA signal recognition particle [Altererythrobacter sp. B11]